MMIIAKITREKFFPQISDRKKKYPIQMYIHMLPKVDCRFNPFQSFPPEEYRRFIKVSPQMRAVHGHELSG